MSIPKSRLDKLDCLYLIPPCTHYCYNGQAFTGAMTFQQKDTQYTDTQHNASLDYGNQHNDTQHSYTDHNGINNYNKAS